jgi:hypothetical protein
MSKAAHISEPASGLEHLIADLSGLGQLLFVFGDDFAVTHLTGTIKPVFRGPADRRWWHVRLADDTANWTIDVGVDQTTGVPVRARALPVPVLSRAGGPGGAVPRAGRGPGPRLRHGRPV